MLKMKYKNYVKKEKLIVSQDFALINLHILA